MRYVFLAVILFLVINPAGLESTDLPAEIQERIVVDHNLHVYAQADRMDSRIGMDCIPADYELASMSAYELYKLDPSFVNLKKMSRRDVVQMIIEISYDYDINPAIVLAIAKAESGFNIRALSHKGAIGLMQLMPGTAKFLRVNPHNPVENVIGGIRYFKAMRAKFAGYTTLGLAAYNAGPGRVKNLSIPAIPETQQYVSRVYDHYHEYSKEFKI